MKPLIVFYSYSGTTRKLAEDIALITAGELRELKPKRAYSFSYNTAVKEIRSEIENGHCPPLSEGAEGIDDFNTVFVGSPNWLKSLAPPVLTFLREVDLDGKTIIPFCTHGGGGFGNMIEVFQRECKKSVIKEGIALTMDYTFDDVQEWLNRVIDDR